MRVFRRRAFGLAIPLLALFSLPAHSQNLLLNPGFDRDLSGWDVRTYFNYTGTPDATATWAATNSVGGGSGSVQFWLRGFKATVNRVLLSQCVAVQPGHRYTGGGLVRTDEQLLRGVLVRLELFASDGCTGSVMSPGATDGLSLVPLPYPENDSGGRWLPASASAVADATARSVRFSFGLDAVTYGSNYTLSSFDGFFDDAFLVEQADPAAAWILPSAAKLSGAAGSVWTTGVTLANPDAADALVTLKFLGHDGDGSSGPEKTLFVRAGSLLEYPDVLGTLFGGNQAYGALSVASSNPRLVAQSETSTPVPGGGTVGQALPAFGPADFAGATPRTLAPIRENASFRTNLVLANPTGIPVTAHVELFATDGTTIGSRGVDLPPLGMTQINRVAAALGAATLDAGRIAVSTATPGGLLAAYASVIDNVTNDPRTLLPQDATPAKNGPSLLVNPGFDRDLSGWTLTLSGPETHRSGAWDSKDVDGNVGSGSALLGAGYEPGTTVGIWALLRQCVPVISGRSYGLQARVNWSSGGIFGFWPLPLLRFSFYASSDCTGDTLGVSNYSQYQFTNSGAWLVVPTSSSVAPSPARSASVEIGAAATYFGGISAYFDDVVFSEGLSIWTPVVPAAASIGGVGGSFWTTTLTLANPTPALTTTYLGVPPRNLSAGHMQSIPDVLRTVYGNSQSQTWSPLVFDTTSPAVSITAETSTPVPGGGTVGQALAAFGPRDFAGSTPKTIAPIRDNGAFRTNLVLVNVTSAPLIAHVNLFDAAGASIGSRDVPLDAGAATQIGAVGWTLSGGSVDAGRLSVSTPTPGGLLAAYASVIDNVTNDPRTLLPR